MNLQHCLVKRNICQSVQTKRRLSLKVVASWQLRSNTSSVCVKANSEHFERSNSLFTPPTRTRQDSLVLSVSAVWTSCPHNFNLSWLLRLHHCDWIWLGFLTSSSYVLRQFSSIQLQMYIAPWVENKSEAPSKKCLLRLWRQREYNCLSINKPLHGRQALWGHVGATAPNSFLAIHVSARFWHVMWAPPMCLPLCVCVSSSRHIM